MPAEGEVTREKVASALNEVKPALQADGGDVELVDVQEAVVKVRLAGECSGCPRFIMTVKNLIELMLKDKVPGVKEVVAVQ